MLFASTKTMMTTTTTDYDGMAMSMLLWRSSTRLSRGGNEWPMLHCLLRAAKSSQERSVVVKVLSVTDKVDVNVMEHLDKMVMVK